MEAVLICLLVAVVASAVVGVGRLAVLYRILGELDDLRTTVERMDGMMVRLSADGGRPSRRVSDTPSSSGGEEGGTGVGDAPAM